MKEYIVYFITVEEKIGKYAKRRFISYFEKVKNPPLEQFLDKEWCHANSKQEAADNIQREHWNIDHIDLVEEL